MEVRFVEVEMRGGECWESDGGGRVEGCAAEGVGERGGGSGFYGGDVACGGEVDVVGSCEVGEVYGGYEGEVLGCGKGEGGG